MIADADKLASLTAPIPSAMAASEKAAADKVVDVGQSVAGRKSMKGSETKDLYSGKGAPVYPKGDAANDTTPEEQAETEEDHKVETELNAILKKGPSKCFSSCYPRSLSRLVFRG